ncbi:dihydrofolate reductase family protein [Mariniflexile litorale]|uniref:Dihydrofolate reductase family protein n=1 Tax=Mariniflexile litorale TaxID=3045158 RepID=A0AAU7EGM3_9FLAO|nr:dihydrofolate reductase family protein [Mariniflexile sp. KMM 9835]MDQ8212029.1 dihydrofolate reductase family protein [Mariniflexile sp. KMM 9835]
MATLKAFTFITLNGFYKNADNDISWHQHGKEETKYSEENLKSENILLLGRHTYQMMESFWTSQMAYDNFPEVAKGMDHSKKIVVSASLEKVNWNNTSVMNGNLIDEIKELKKTSKHNITILGSGSLITQLTNVGLIDTYEIMLDPIAIGQGTSIFNGILASLHLKLIACKTLKSGTVLLNYIKL